MSKPCGGTQSVPNRKDRSQLRGIRCCTSTLPIATQFPPLILEFINPVYKEYYRNEHVFSCIYVARVPHCKMVQVKEPFPSRRVTMGAIVSVI